MRWASSGDGHGSPRCKARDSSSAIMRAWSVPSSRMSGAGPMSETSELPNPPSDDRWLDIGNRWYERLELVGTLIPRGASVLDLGAGAQGLRELVSGPYTPADLFLRTHDTLHFSMDEDIYPKGRWDVVVMSGVL